MTSLKLNPGSFFNNLKIAFSPDTPPMVPLTLIWYDVKTSAGWQNKIFEGDLVFISKEANGKYKLCNCMDLPNARITGLWGTSNGKQFKVSVMLKDSRELKLIDL